MIPKVIHYCWFGSNPYPKIVKDCIKTWKKYCPDYEIKLWDESNYDISKNEWLRNAYNSKKWAFVSDYARLDIIFNEGGIYLDTDVELIKTLDDLLHYNCFLAIENENAGLINTGIGFGAVKNHPAIKEMLNEYNSLVFSENNVMGLLCPELNTKPFLREGYKNGAKEIQTINDATILPAEYFDPKDGNLSELHITKNTHGIHLGSRLWETGLTRWKAKVRMFIGIERCRKIERLYKWIER